MTHCHCHIEGFSPKYLKRKTTREIFRLFQNLNMTKVAFGLPRFYPTRKISQ
ncbi:hypothetical protein [Helicobacter sp. T3_23-1059]